ncbi:MAG: hypothetical protein U9O90_09000 [Euryarchaeota archaeon]|nr:hypothetical protein [Euryarchaeota archaeon]
MKKRKITGAILKIACLTVFTAFLILHSGPVCACDVPVFRYALERWPAATYEIVVFHEGPLNGEAASVVSWLVQSSYENKPSANFLVNTVDLSTEIDDSTRALWQSLDLSRLPLLVVRQPESGIYRGSVWSSWLSMDAAKKIVDSPSRQEISKRIMDGEAAVLVLVESGNPAYDDDAAKIISEQLSQAEKELTLSSQFLDRADLEELEASPTPNFSVVQVSRDDPAEDVFVNMLMYCEPDLFEYQSDPLAFPIYGRGRALYALAGRGITRENIYYACATTIGPCSCTVKDSNPSIDMLMVADWRKGIGKSWIDEEIPLVGLGTFIRMAEKNNESSGNNESLSLDSVTTGSTDNGSETEACSSSNILVRNVFIACGAVVVTIIPLSLRVLRTGGKRK